MVAETDDAEDDAEDDEAHYLNGFAANSIHQGYGDPVPRDGAGADDDQVADGLIVEDLMHVAPSDVANGIENDSVVQAKTKRKPRPEKTMNRPCRARSCRSSTGRSGE